MEDPFKAITPELVESLENVNPEPYLLRRIKINLTYKGD